MWALAPSILATTAAYRISSGEPWRIFSLLPPANLVLLLAFLAALLVLAGRLASCTAPLLTSDSFAGAALRVLINLSVFHFAISTALSRKRILSRHANSHPAKTPRARRIVLSAYLVLLFWAMADHPELGPGDAALAPGTAGATPGAPGIIPFSTTETTAESSPSLSPGSLLHDGAAGFPSLDNAFYTPIAALRARYGPATDSDDETVAPDSTEQLIALQRFSALGTPDDMNAYLAAAVGRAALSDGDTDPADDLNADADADADATPPEDSDDDTYYTSPGSGYHLPYRAVLTKALLSAVSDIAKFKDIRSLTGYRRFINDLAVVVNNFSDSSRTWNVVDIFINDPVTKLLKVFPTVGDTDYTEAVDADQIFLAVLMAVLAGEAAGCVDTDAAALRRPGAGRLAFDRLEKLVRNKSNAFSQSVKRQARDWAPTFSTAKHPTAQLAAYRDIQRELGKKDDDSDKDDSELARDDIVRE